MSGRREGNRRPDSRRLTAQEAEDAARRALEATEKADAEIRARKPDYLPHMTDPWAAYQGDGRRER